MEIAEVSGELESRIVFLMATEDQFISELAPIFIKGMLTGKYTNKAANLCLAYYRKFEQAPKEKLDAFFRNAVSMRKIDNQTAAEMQVIFAGFQKQNPVTDIDFEIEEALKYLQGMAIQLSADEAAALVAEGKIEEAQALLLDLENFNRMSSGGSDVYEDDNEELTELFTKEDERLIKFPGELGKLMNNVMVRRNLVTLIGRGKVGKSFWLIYVARVARNQRRRVIFFTCGDLTKSKVKKRIMQGDAQTTTSKDYLDKQRIPYLDCVKNQQGTCFERDGEGTLFNEWNQVDPYIKSEEYKPCCKCKDSRFEATVSYKRVQRPLLDDRLAIELKERWNAKPHQGVLHIEHAPLGTLSCAELALRTKAICRKRGWDNPDLLVLDYADAMKDEDRDTLKSVDTRWRFLRRYADVFNCCVLTATQSNRSGFDNSSDLSLASLSEDKRKADHVAALIAINQTIEERAEDIWRLAALLKREDAYDERHQCKVYGCLAMGTPHFASHHHFAEPPKMKKAFM